MRKQLHPGAKWSFRLRTYFAMIFLSFFIGWFIAPFFIVMYALIFGQNSIPGIIFGVIGFGIFYIIFTIIIGEIYARMAYNRWFYEFTDAQLRTERGIIWKKYSNLPYERIQNIDISRGILARMLGFSTVHIQTAGFSYAPNSRGMGSEGYIPAVTMQEAEHIREFLMKKISKNGRNQGL
ncbi:PH domain-containing protein [Candidatus Pacearchaeota archaeon]|nr:PH domain-containing protein [Candidatus Pacearchaeota archaeon]